MKPQHTLDQCAEGLRQLALTKRTTDEFAASVLHYLAEYRRLAKGKPLLADGTVARSNEDVWCMGVRYAICDVGEGVAYKCGDDAGSNMVCLSECHRTREASMDAKP